jgi:hypothetical protein
LVQSGSRMDKLKLYAAPLVALVLILLWFFVLSPMLDEGEPATAEPSATTQGSN